jgi:hypothetical protein
MRQSFETQMRKNRTFSKQISEVKTFFSQYLHSLSGSYYVSNIEALPWLLD